MNLNITENRFALTIANPESEEFHIKKKEERHILTLVESDENQIYLQEQDQHHVLTLVTPVALGSGTGNYNDLIHKPTINNVELIGNLSLEDLGIIINKLPIASATRLGGIKVGRGLAIDPTGVLYTTTVVPIKSIANEEIDAIIASYE